MSPLTFQLSEKFSKNVLKERKITLLFCLTKFQQCDKIILNTDKLSDARRCLKKGLKRSKMGKNKNKKIDELNIIS